MPLSHTCKMDSNLKNYGICNYHEILEKSYKRPGGEELNLDQTGMCHQRLKFITLFGSGKTQKGYPALELPLFLIYCIVLYCIVLYSIVLEKKFMFKLYLFNQMSLPFSFSSIMFVQKSFKFSITVVSLSYDICIAFQD